MAAEANKICVCDQKTDALGRTTLYLSDAGVRLDAPKVGLVCVSSAPKWDVCIFKPADKRFTEMSFEKFLNMDSVYFYNDTAELMKSATISQQGKHTVYSFKARTEPERSLLFQSNESARKSEPVTAVLTCEKERYEKHALAVAQKYLSLKNVEGIPISMEYHGDNRNATWTPLVTYSKKYVTDNTISFAAPKGYESVQFVDKLFAGADTEGVLFDYFGPDKPNKSNREAKPKAKAK